MWVDVLGPVGVTLGEAVSVCTCIATVVCDATFQVSDIATHDELKETDMFATRVRETVPDPGDTDFGTSTNFFFGITCAKENSGDESFETSTIRSTQTTIPALPLFSSAQGDRGRERSSGTGISSSTTVYTICGTGTAPLEPSMPVETAM